MTRQQKILAHHEEQFGHVSVHQIISKLTEEVGEVAANVTRWTECRTGDAWDDRALDEVGDVLIVLTALCGALGGDIDDVYATAAERFLQREWQIKRGRT